MRLGSSDANKKRVLNILIDSSHYRQNTSSGRFAEVAASLQVRSSLLQHDDVQ